VEYRKLNDIRKSRRDFDCQGPDTVYAITAKATDVVIFPTNWVLATISAAPNNPLTFGA
jgi:hypothetical protein